MNFPAGGDARPEARRLPARRSTASAIRSGTWATSHTYPNNLQSCHEVEIYPDDRLACSSITATLLLDLRARSTTTGRRTTTWTTSRAARRCPAGCGTARRSVSPFATAAKVTDCVDGGTDAQPQNLRVMSWLAIGAPSLEGVTRIGTVHHMGFTARPTTRSSTPPFDATEDIVAAHESELTNSQDFVITSDERGGGVVPGGATLLSGRRQRARQRRPSRLPGRELRHDTAGGRGRGAAGLRERLQGDRAIYRAQIRTGPQGSFCTAHVFQQIPGQNRIFMGWYSQGTQVVDFDENPDGTVDFKEAGCFTPLNANTWTSAIFKVERKADGSFTYYGATGDGILPGSGRSAIDIYKVTLPGPPIPAGGVQPGTPVFPLADESAGPGTGAGTCAAAAAFNDVRVQPRRLGLRFSFIRRGRAPVRVQLLRETVGRRVTRRKLIGDFGVRRRGFRFRGRGRRLRNGHYVVRFRSRAANGAVDTRLVALVRSKGRFRLRPDIGRRQTCALLDSFSLRRSVFGGARRIPLVAQFRLSQEASVTVEVRRRGKLVKRFAPRLYGARRTHTLRLRSRRRGDYTLNLTASSPGKTDTATVTGRRL